MQTKLTVKENIVTGIMNALGFGKRRGGAGAVVAALAIFAVVGCLAISVVGESTTEKVSSYVNLPDGEISEPTFEPEPWEQPVKQESKSDYNGAVPSRLPC